MNFLHTLSFRRRKLPHWEVENGRYFVTVRLADSLPKDAVMRLQEIHCALTRIVPQSPQFAALQRQYFRTMDKYLDANTGACILKLHTVAACVIEELDSLCDWNVTVPHYAIMPNHWHALIVPECMCTHSLAEVMKRVKGRTGKRIRTLVGGAGMVWQPEWFDRWVRDGAEWDRMVRYIQQNPAKAGLVAPGESHPWTR